MKTGNDDALDVGQDDLMGDNMEGVELDMSLLFGEEDGDDDLGDDDGETVEAPEVVDDNQPDVIDTTKEQGSDDPAAADKADKPNAANVKEIDGQLWVAVNADNAEVMSKDGKHAIPYDVLERARNGSSEAQAKIAELERKNAELDSQYKTSSQKQALAEKQLTDAGIDLEKLPEEVLNDPEALQRIKDELPGEAGAILEALVGRIKQSESQNPAPQQEVQAQSTGNPVNDVLAADNLKELNGWLDSDPDRWDMALTIDKRLQSDPEFSSKPIEERFAEVQRRTKLAFGDPVQAGIDQELAAQEQREQAAKQPAKQPQVIPNSPSDISSGGRSAQSIGHEALASQDALSIERAMETMSPDEIEALLEEAGGAFE